MIKFVLNAILRELETRPKIKENALKDIENVLLQYLNKIKQYKENK